MGRHPVRDRADRRDPRHHQPRLPGGRAPVRAHQGRRQRAGHGPRLPRHRLRRRCWHEVRGQLPGPARGDRARRRLGRLPRRRRTASATSSWPSARRRCSSTTRSTSSTRRAPPAFPKGATLSHHNILNNAYFTGDALRYTEHDRVCVPVPFYHCFGMVLGTLACVAARRVHGRAGRVVRPAAVLAAVEAERCTVALRRADDVHRRARRAGLRPRSTCPACAPA